jgi:hypothetical protein
VLLLRLQRVLTAVPRRLARTPNAMTQELASKAGLPGHVSMLARVHPAAWHGAGFSPTVYWSKPAVCRSGRGESQ